jgi:hypothetical protein
MCSYLPVIHTLIDSYTTHALTYKGKVEPWNLVAKDAKACKDLKFVGNEVPYMDKARKYVSHIYDSTRRWKDTKSIWHMLFRKHTKNPKHENATYQRMSGIAH